MENNPHDGVDGAKWKPAPKVTLQINGETGVVVEERRGEVITTSFIPSSEEDEQDVLEETGFT